MSSINIFNQDKSIPTTARVKQEYPDVNPFWTGLDKRQVGIWLRIFRVLDINLSQQTITIRLVLIIKWLDQYFGSKNSKPDQKDNRGFFNDTSNCPSAPKIRFENSTSNYQVDLEFLWTNPQGVCHWQRWGKITLTNPINARNFPFDYQSFIVDLKLKRDFQLRYDRYFCTQRSHQNEYNQNRIHICTYNTNIPQWTVCGFSNQDSFYVPRDDMHVTPLPVKSNLKSGWDASYQTLIVIRRRPQYYFLNIWLLTSFLTWLATPTFSLDTTDLSSRQSYLVTLLLVLLGVRFSFSIVLPNISYITTLDLKLFFSLGALIVLLVLFSLPSASQYENAIWIVWLVLAGSIDVVMVLIGIVRAIGSKLQLQKKAELFYEQKDRPLRIQINSINGAIPEIKKQ